MRTKENKLVISFASTTAAMAFEAACKQQGVPGRLIPIPSEITAGCGLAWCADPCDQEKVRVAIQNFEILVDGVYELKL